MLHHVVEYARTHLSDSESGFTRRDILWLFRLNAEGVLLGVEPIQDKKSKRKLKTNCPDMPNMRAGGDAKRSHFLVEVASAALCYGSDQQVQYRSTEDGKLVRRHSYFKNLIKEAAIQVPPLGPINVFLRDLQGISEACLKAGASKVGPNDWIKFCVGDYDPNGDPTVLNWWRNWLKKDFVPEVGKTEKRHGKKKILQRDLLTGELVDAQETHPPVKGLVDVGGNAQTPLVSMDKSAFRSYGLKSSLNAPVGKQNAQLYADGLSHLLESSEKIAGARMAYWYQENLSEQLDPIELLLRGMYSSEQIEHGSLMSARDLLRSVKAGKRPLSTNNLYFAVTLSGSMGRVMVRDWIEGQFDDLLDNTIQWFEGLEIVGLSGTRSAPDPKLETVVTSLLPEKPDQQKYADWVKPIGSARRDLWHAALDARLPIPVAALGRTVVEAAKFMASESANTVLFSQRRDEASDVGGLVVARLYARMGLIKAFFVRKPLGKGHMKPYLNPDHPDPAYHCGRLLAILAKLQHAALGDIGAGVVQRFYPAASTAPGLTMGRLVGNSRNHLGKLDGGLTYWYEQQIADVMGRLGDKFPRTLDLEGQGLFALGYYQQLAALRPPKKNGKDNNQDGESE